MDDTIYYTVEEMCTCVKPEFHKWRPSKTRKLYMCPKVATQAMENLKQSCFYGHSFRVLKLKIEKSITLY